MRRKHESHTHTHTPSQGAGRPGWFCHTFIHTQHQAKLINTHFLHRPTRAHSLAYLPPAPHPSVYLSESFCKLTKHLAAGTGLAIVTRDFKLLDAPLFHCLPPAHAQFQSLHPPRSPVIAFRDTEPSPYSFHLSLLPFGHPCPCLTGFTFVSFRVPGCCTPAPIPSPHSLPRRLCPHYLASQSRLNSRVCASL